MKHFTLEELSRTSTGVLNTPTPEAIKSLEILVANILDPLREAMGEPIRITSGYRSPRVNRIVGGAPTSQHTQGEAVDFVCEHLPEAFHYIRQHLPFDQLIWERGDAQRPAWVHVSLRREGRNRHIVLRFDGKAYKSI